MNPLIVLFLIPFFSALIVFFLPLKYQKTVKSSALFLSLIPLAWLIVDAQSWVDRSVDYPWIPSLGIHFYLRVDPLSLLFLFLTALIVPISILAPWIIQLQYPNFYYMLVLTLQGLLIGFFSARDLVVFFIFWEAMLLPLYFILKIWGADQGQAAFKFLLYMLAGSALMLFSVFGLYVSAGNDTFNLDRLAHNAISGPLWIFPFFLLAFAVKTPLFPFHAWLPDAYSKAPTSGSILLAGLLSKAGIYGIVRIGYELFPQAIRTWSVTILSLAIIGVLYGGVLAWMQKDFKRLLAYSSFAHVNFILIGLFAWTESAHTGAILQAINHSITITALFLTAAWLEERLGTTAFGQHRGLASIFPRLCWITLFCVLSSIALPGLNNFVGEFMILFGFFGLYSWLAVLPGLTLILSAIYMLRWIQKVFFESYDGFNSHKQDISLKEICISFPLLLLMIGIGIYPAPILDQIKPAVETLLKHNF